MKINLDSRHILSKTLSSHNNCNEHSAMDEKDRENKEAKQRLG